MVIHVNVGWGHHSVLAYRIPVGVVRHANVAFVELCRCLFVGARVTILELVTSSALEWIHVGRVDQ